MPTGVEFVPMIWGKRDIPEIGQAKGGVLLGFNEPERSEQSNLTVEEALALWPQLEATKMRLGSPAPAHGPKGMRWLEQFMAGCAEKKLRVDFICLHWYGPNQIQCRGIASPD
jgi:Glycosyl hydrolase catalytic core